MHTIQLDSRHPLEQEQLSPSSSFPSSPSSREILSSPTPSLISDPSQSIEISPSKSPSPSDLPSFISDKLFDAHLSDNYCYSSIEDIYKEPTSLSLIKKSATRRLTKLKRKMISRRKILSNSCSHLVSSGMIHEEEDGPDDPSTVLDEDEDVWYDKETLFRVSLSHYFCYYFLLLVSLIIFYLLT